VAHQCDRELAYQLGSTLTLKQEELQDEFWHVLDELEEGRYWTFPLVASHLDLSVG